MGLHRGFRKAEPSQPEMNLQPATVPRHYVVVADDALVGEAADAFEIIRSGRQSFSVFLNRTMLVVALEAAAAIAVEGQGARRSVAAGFATEANNLRRFLRGRTERRDFAGGVILQAQSGAAFEAIARGAVESDEFFFAGGAQTALAMNGRATFARRAQTDSAQDAAEPQAKVSRWDRAFDAPGRAFPSAGPEPNRGLC